MRNPVGAHVPVAGGLATGGLKYAAEIGAEAIQVFVANPRGWALPEGKPAQDEKLRAADLPVYVHTPYLVNFGSPSPETLAKSIASVRHSLTRGHAIGARGVVVHTGSSVTQTYDEAMAQVHDHVLPLLEEIPEDGPDLLLEPMAGQNNMLCAKVQDLAPFFDRLENHPKLGVCFDTCHAFAAGHDLASPGGAKDTIDALIATVGEGRLQLIHANDSKDPCASGRDRHENIGAGHIGEPPFTDLFQHPATANIPFLIETPGRAPAPHAKDIKTLKHLRTTP
ncbi:deoxyribonuclease IV [Actinomadura meridiana]|uniref:Probable endonuclease 4 n=1 Tax=Actinomadura meridiana TaxID=559626 RepID=A0ABP8BY28_9ACTN